MRTKNPLLRLKAHLCSLTPCPGYVMRQRSPTVCNPANMSVDVAASMKARNGACAQLEPHTHPSPYDFSYVLSTAGMVLALMQKPCVSPPS